MNAPVDSAASLSNGRRETIEQLAIDDAQIGAVAIGDSLCGVAKIVALSNAET